MLPRGKMLDFGTSLNKGAWSLKPEIRHLVQILSRVEVCGVILVVWGDEHYELSSNSEWSYLCFPSC